MPRQKPLTVLVIVTPLLTSLALVTLAACGGPEPKMMVANKKDDGVAANSASEERLASEGKPKAAAPGPASDPTQPYTTPVGGGDTAASGGAAASGAPAGKGSGKKGDPKGDPKAPPAKSTAGKVSQAECKQLFDKYIDLTVGSDARFEGMGADIIAQLKEQALAQAKQQKGDPCSTEEVSRTQYTCAMASTTTSAWQKCLK